MLDARPCDQRICLVTICVIDTDVVSCIYKRDTRADLYHTHLNDPPFIISFMSLANCLDGRSSGSVAKHDGKSLKDIWPDIWSSTATTKCAIAGPR